MRVLHTATSLKFAYCAFYVCACGITFYISNYCSLISKTHQSNHQSAYLLSSAYLHSIFIEALPKIKKKTCGTSGKIISEMKGHVGMSLHEREGVQEVPRPRQEIIDNPIPTSLFFNFVATQLTLGAHAQRWLLYLVCPSVCDVCVCLYTSRTAGNEAAREQYARLQRNTRTKNNVADLAKTAAFWQEKPAPPWTTFHDPTDQLAQCACVFITRLLDCLSPSAALSGVLHCYFQVPLACFRTVLSPTRVCSYR